jgi:hypothetical protein
MRLTLADTRTVPEVAKKNSKKKRKSTKSGEQAPVVIEVRDGEFQWDLKSTEPTLKDVNVTIR